MWSSSTIFPAAETEMLIFISTTQIMKEDKIYGLEVAEQQRNNDEIT